MLIILPVNFEKIAQRRAGNVKPAVILPFSKKPSHEPDTDPDGSPAAAMQVLAA
jgi:hypothetical protein